MQKIKKDVSLELLDGQGLCQECVKSLIFKLKDSDVDLVDKFGQRISPWNAVDHNRVYAEQIYKDAYKSLEESVKIAWNDYEKKIEF